MLKKTYIKSSFSLIQKIGTSLMLPVSVLPVAGLLLGIGSAHFTWMPAALSEIMAQSGGAIFGSLPLIFAIAVAVGLTENDGVAALASTVGFVVLLATLGVIAKLQGHETATVMGMPSVDTGVFGGIVMGAIAAYLFKRYYRIQLPSYLGFFAGKRFVPIVTALAAIGVAGVLSILWPPIQLGIDKLSHFAAYESPTMAATLYGVVERLLIPFGLHHIWNVPFFFEIGSFTDQAGKIVHGDINRFFAGDPTAGILGGAYLFKMWGLPAAALAIWQCAKPEQKTKVGSIMISAALTSFLTGITEPIEFSFLFVAPSLYFLHALLAGASQFLFGVLGAKLGFTFSQGFIDYILYFPLDTKPWLVLVVGPAVAGIYYAVFRTMILKFNLKTPGRESDEASFESIVGEFAEADQRAIALVKAFGGRKNIKSLDACITRLRVELNDMNLLQVDRLKAMGAAGVLTVGKGVQAIFGPQSENLKSDMEEVLKKNIPELDSGFIEDADQSSGSQSLKSQDTENDPDASRKVAQWIEAMGGVQNIVSAQVSSGTRLRVELKDSKLLNSAELSKAGVQAVVLFQNEIVHLIVGLAAPSYGAAISKYVG